MSKDKNLVTIDLGGEVFGVYGFSICESCGKEYCFRAGTANGLICSDCSRDSRNEGGGK